MHLQRERRWHDRSAASSSRRQPSRASTSTTPSTTSSARSDATTRRWRATQQGAQTGQTGAPSRTWTWREARKTRAAADSALLCEWTGDGQAAGRGEGATPNANTGDTERGDSVEDAKNNGPTPLTHKLDRRAREHPHAKITPTGGIFGCSNLIFGAGLKGPC